MPQNNQKAALEALKSFEKDADKAMAALSIWGLPFRSIYSSVILGAEAVFNGGRFDVVREPDLEKGATILARLTYLRSYLSLAGPEIGTDLRNALDAVAPEMHVEISQALVYAHFCELMPFAHRKAFKIEQTADGFRLSYPTDEAAYFEALDVIASELALTAVARNFPSDPGPYLRMIETWPHLEGQVFHGVLAGAYEFHLKNVLEDIFIGAEAYERVLGFTHDEFKRVRAALMAYGTWCLGMANAAELTSMDAPWSCKTFFARSTPIIIFVICRPLRCLTFKDHNSGTLRCRLGRRQPPHLVLTPTSHENAKGTTESEVKMHAAVAALINGIVAGGKPVRRP